MNGLLSKLTVTPLLYACGVLLLTVLGLSAALKIEASRVDVAQAQAGAAQQRVVAVITERDAWKSKAAGDAEANQAANEAIASLKAALLAEQAASARNAQANAQALTAARAEAADADRTLHLFTRKFQTESRKPDCTRALEALEAACPALRDY